MRVCRSRPLQLRGTAVQRDRRLHRQSISRDGRKPDRPVGREASACRPPPPDCSIDHQSSHLVRRRQTAASGVEQPRRSCSLRPPHTILLRSRQRCIAAREERPESRGRAPLADECFRDLEPSDRTSPLATKRSSGWTPKRAAADDRLRAHVSARCRPPAPGLAEQGSNDTDVVRPVVAPRDRTQGETRAAPAVRPVRTKAALDPPVRASPARRATSGTRTDRPQGDPPTGHPSLNPARRASLASGCPVRPAR